MASSAGGEPRRPAWLYPAAALAAAAPFLATIARRGFYLDDHVHLETALAAPLTATLAAQVARLGPFRLLHFGWIAIQFSALGANALAHQALLLTVHMVNAALVYAVARALRWTRESALGAALIFAVLPWHGQFPCWPTCSVQGLSAAALLGAWWVFLRHARGCRRRVPTLCEVGTPSTESEFEGLRGGSSSRETGRSARRCSALVGAWVLFAAAVSFYEQALAWAVVWPLVAWSLTRTHAARRAAWTAVAGFAVVAILMACVSVMWAPHDWGQSRPDLAGLPGKTARVLLRAAEKAYLCVAGFRSFHGPALAGLARESPPGFLVLAAGCTAMAFAAWRAASAPPDPAARRLVRRPAWAAFLAAALVAPLAFFALHRTPYVPQRMLYLPSLALPFALMSAWRALQARLGDGAARRAAAGALAAGLCVASLVTAARTTEFVAAQRLQQALAADLAQARGGVPPGSTIAVRGLPDALGAAPLFENSHALTALVNRVAGRSTTHFVLVDRGDAPAGAAPELVFHNGRLETEPAPLRSFP